MRTATPPPEAREAGGLDLLTKAGAVLSALEAEGELSATALADLVEQPVSSVYRLLANLQAVGWVDAGSRRGLFRLGVACLQIGARLAERLDVRAAARPELRRLQEGTGATSFLCVPREERAVCIERVEGRDVRWLAMRLGDSLPMHRGGAPLALLAFLPAGEQDALVERFAATSDLTVARLRARIRQTRRRGYAVSDQDVTPGVAAVGAPVFNHRGELEASVSVSGLRDAVLADRGLPETVVRAAEAVSRALGRPV